MAYSKQTWDTTSYVNPTRLNHIEDGLFTASSQSETASELLGGANVNGYVKTFGTSENADNAPSGLRKGLNVVGKPSMFTEWALYETFYYDDTKNFGWQRAYDMASNQVAYRYKRSGAWSDWQKFATTEYPKCLVTSGWILNSSTGQINGVGVANVTLFASGLAEINFEVEITGKDESKESTFAWGLNSEFLHNLNPNIPYITPFTGGSARFTDNVGTILTTYNGHGASFIAITPFWNPARIYASDGSIGGWGSSEFSVGNRISGTCYGTFTP